MLLHDIGKSPDATFRRINQHLESNYGLKISEDVTDKDLVAIMEKIEDEITDLKMRGDDAKASPEISKRLLVLEGVRNLREFAMMQFQSPKLEGVIGNLSDYVVHTFEITGKDSSDFERAVERAMDEYRSSKFRFPDDFVEQRVRQNAMARIQADMAMSNAGDIAADIDTTTPVVMEDEEQDDAIGDSEMNGIEEATVSSIPDIKPEDAAKYKTDELDLEPPGKSGVVFNPNTGKKQADPWKAQAEKRAQGRVMKEDEIEEGNDRSEFSANSGLDPNSRTGTPMVRDKTSGRMVQDPFAAHAAARKQGISSMKEHANLVKNLRRLLETEVSQAEVMMAAKGFAQELQEMVEKIGRLQNEDLPPVTDQMRETYGMESASAFQTQIYGALQSVMDALYTAKQQVDDAVGNMAATGQVSAAVDMDKDLGMDDGMGGMDDTMGMDADADLDNIEADMGGDDMGDDFGAEDGEEPLGRAMKMESVLQKRVMEMQKLVAKARKLKEARN